MNTVSDGESSTHSFSSLENTVEVLTSAVKQEGSICMPDLLAESEAHRDSSDDRRHAGGGKMKQSKSSASSCSLPSKGDKLCCVCGDKALGCNFDAVSCESCKAFFRRNALKPKQTKCIFEGNCKIDVNTRRFCSFCRLKKCFAVGMNKDLILGDDEKKKRLEKVKRNRQSTTTTVGTTRSLEDSDSFTALSPYGDNDVLVLPPDSPGNIVIVPQSAPSLPQPVITVQPVSVSQGSVVSAPPLSSIELLPEHADQIAEMVKTKLLTLGAAGDLSFLPVVLGGGKGASSLETVIAQHTIGQATPHVTLVEDSDELLRTLTAEEDQLLQEIVQVYDLSFTVDLEPLVHIRQLDPSLNQLVNQSSMTILRLIKFAKRLNEFARLPQNCQIGILKGCWIHILILRSVSVYDSERDVWVTPRGDIPTEILKNATGFVKLHDDHVQYCKSIKSIINNDLTIVIILLAIVLFSPESPHAVARKLVSDVQDRYLMLLKHYLESRYGYSRAAVMFPELMSKLRELKEFAEIHGRCVVDINPSEIEPIMLEILDLK